MRALAVAMFVLLAAATGRAQTGADHVRLDAMADTTEVRPGRPFRVAVRLRIDPGWHVYWTNPGDSGLPTRVRLALPVGFTAGGVQYPTPTVLHLPGGITDYGYEGQAVLLVGVTPPKRLADGDAGEPYAIGVNVDFLVCRENCIPGKASAVLNLFTSDQPQPAHAAVFEDAVAHLPRELGGAVDTCEHLSPAAAGGEGRIEVRWRSDAADRVRGVEFVPPAAPGCDVERSAAVTERGLTQVRYALADANGVPRPARADGVLIVTEADGSRHGFTVPIFPADPPGQRRTVYDTKHPPAPAVGRGPVPPDRSSP